jgi:excisionase family DNA binding protein
MARQESDPRQQKQIARIELQRAMAVSGMAKVRLEPKTYTVEQATEILGISRAGAYEPVARGEIPHLRIGKRILVPRSALHRLIEAAGTGVTGPSESDDPS